jgi:hypothetical protein
LQRFSNVLAAEKTCFLVYRIQFLEGDDEITMWANPEPGTRPPPEDAAAVSPTIVRDFRFNRIRFCSAPTPMSFDGLRVGTTYADVAPTITPAPREVSGPGASLPPAFQERSPK